MLSSAFVRGESYGTRCSTIVTVDAGGATTFAEWTWDRAGALAGMTRYHFQVA